MLWKTPVLVTYREGVHTLLWKTPVLVTYREGVIHCYGRLQFWQHIEKGSYTVMGDSSSGNI